MSNPAWGIRTGRLLLEPVGWEDLPELRALKADAGVYGQMLGGVRTAGQVAEELAEDLSFWSRMRVGMWTVREGAGRPMLGLAGVHERRDGRGIALRFAFRPEARGRGLAREAAGAALRFAHDRAELARIVAVAWDENIGSRTVLGAIGMRDCGTFQRDGKRMLMFESLAARR